MSKTGVAVLGIFVVDLAFRAGNMPAIGETVAGSGFAMGPGGKGSNRHPVGASIARTGAAGATADQATRRTRSVRLFDRAGRPDDN